MRGSPASGGRTGPSAPRWRSRTSTTRRDIRKFNPLALWPDDAVWQYIRRHEVPFNPLHERGYPSIGCEPCTRAIRGGEPARAGRWWWESEGAQKECGLHVVAATHSNVAEGT